MKNCNYKHVPGSSKFRPFINLAWLFPLVPFLLMIQCKSNSVNKDVRMVDTLIKWANMAKETQVIDPKVISDRIDSMEIKIEKLKIDSQKIHNVEIPYYIKEYEGIYTQYKSFIQEYPALEFDNMQYLRQLEEIKKKIIDRKIMTSEFNHSIYPDYREKVSAHLKESKKLVGNIAAIEEMYNRVNNNLTAVYHELVSGK